MIASTLKPSFVSTSCPLCSSKDKSVVLYDLRCAQIDFGLPGLILKCIICGMTYKKFTKNIYEIYDKKYGEHAISIDYMNGEYTEKFFDTVLTGSKYYNSDIRRKTIRLLDIGTGVGTLLERATALGFEAQGVELCPELVNIGREKGLKIIEGRIEDMHFHREFNVVTMCDIIEHLPFPLSLLQKVKGFLVPGGELIIYTPNHNSPIVRLGKLLKSLGINHLISVIFAENHVSFFDEKTITSILNRAGFSPISLSCKAYDRPGREIPSFVLAIISVIENVGCYLGGLGFRMFIYADCMTESTQNKDTFNKA
ncbi:class I SAM-dependent methyltransferase [bacterium]|nr:class I SAM-dependent methyltransferase [bacterium]